MAFEQLEIPRRKTSWGGEGGPLVIPPGAQHLPGKKKCETCGRMVKPQPKSPRKGTCKCLYYKRTTTFIDVLQDEYLLKQWGNRNVAYGMSQRPDLVLQASSCSPDEYGEFSLDSKRELNLVAAEAQRSAGDKVKATIGTSLHRLTHAMDRGEELGHVPERWVDDLKAYDAEVKRAGIEWVSIESFRVLDDWVKNIADCDHKAPRYGGTCECTGVAGTVDRIGSFRGRLCIFDIKGLALTTPLPTPTGWTTMGAVRVGDQVLDESGKPCTVTVKSDVKRIGTYTVSFSDGSQVVCDSEHIWWTTTKADRIAGRKPVARNMSDIIATMKRSGHPQHAVPLTKPLMLPEVELPIDPYLLGVWLGDGTTREGLITKEQDLFDVLTQDGWEFGVERAHSGDYVARTVVGLQSMLRESKLLGNKHIPDVYLRASHAQRLRLLQGLMDTDGTWDTSSSRAAFYSTSKAMAFAVKELLSTLGQRPYLSSSAATGLSRQELYHVRFLPVDIEPFRLPRKASKVTASSNPGRAQRIITSIEPGPDVETACIGVDSPDHLYLCGETMIPTHNTGSDFNKLGHAMQLAMYAHMVPYLFPGDQRTTDPEQVDLNVGYIIKLPEGKGVCSIEPLDIEMGWRASQLAKMVWEARDWNPVIEHDIQAELQEIASRAKTLKELRLLWNVAKKDGRLDGPAKFMINQRVKELKAQGVTE